MNRQKNSQLEENWLLNAKIYIKLIIIVIANISYKKSTIAFLEEILEYYQITNCLSEYLSSLSDYKYPKMEEIYETSRRERGF